jgi:hypothetical protein
MPGSQRKRGLLSDREISIRRSGFAAGHALYSAQMSEQFAIVLIYLSANAIG